MRDSTHGIAGAKLYCCLPGFINVFSVEKEAARSLLGCGIKHEQHEGENMPYALWGVWSMGQSKNSAHVGAQKPYMMGSKYRIASMDAHLFSLY